MNHLKLLNYIKKHVVSGLGEDDPDQDVVHDLAMDVYVNILERIDEIDHPFTYARTRAFFAGKDYYAHEAKRLDLLTHPGNLDAFERPEPEMPEVVYEQEEGLRYISKLTPALRRAAHDYIIEGLSYKEIAEREGTSEAAIRKRIQRVLEEIENGTA